MTRTDKNEKLIQQLRAQSSPKIVNIFTRVDNTTGERYILWGSIQVCYENAKCIKENGNLVEFMTNDTDEVIIPRRISYHPGVILDVVMKDVELGVTAAQGVYSRHTGISVNRADHSSEADQTMSEYNYLREQDTATIASEQQASHFAITTEKASRRSIIAQSAEQAAVAQQNTQEYLRLYTSYVEANVSGQPIQAASIKSAMQKRFGLWDPQMQSSDVFQIYTLQILQQALDRQAILQNQVQALCIQTHELHQYSIPRLFIVLPKLKRFRDKLFKPFAKQFRLFFLCECGEHTMTEDTMIPHEIHLAKHEGYDIDQPSDFFKRYGSHVLTIMKLLKYGCTIAGIVVPPLAHLNLAEGVETVRKSVEVGVNDIGTLVGDATKYIEDLQDHSGGLDTAPGTMDLNAIEALEGADLRQLESFLRVKDKGRELGNLFQVVTPKGHVKWVCLDHFHDNYRESTKQQLKDIVEANQGSYNIERGAVFIILWTNIVAQQFYEALIKACGVRSLTVTMNWDVSLGDLQMFEDAIRKTSIVELGIWGLKNRKLLVGVINRGRQYDPLLQCMANGKIQQMEIAIDHNFYQHINNSSFMTAPLLHKLCIDSAVPDGKRPPVFVLKSILQCCPALKELKIQTGDILGTFEDFRSKVSQSLSLEKLILHRGMGSSDALTAEICRGVIRTSELQALYLDDDPLHKHNAMVQEGFSISYVPYIRPEDYEAQLIGIMRQNFKLFTVTISCAPGRTRAILDALTDARKAVLLEGGSPAIRRANLRWVNQFDDFTTNPATMSIEFPSTVAADTISTNIGYSGAEEGWGVSFSMEDDEAFAEVLVQYGRFLDTLRMHSTFSDDMAVILNKVLKEQGSAITLLQLAPRSLTAVGLECMGGVIERSHNLAHLEIFSKDLQENSEQWKLEQLLVRYSRRFSRMILSGETPELWIPMVARMCPTRHELPELDLLYITYPDDQDTCPGDQYLPQECVRWIVAMVLPPPRTPATPLSPRPSRAIQEISGTLIDESDQINLVPLPTFSYPWMSLSDLALEMIGLQPQDWEAVIEALDFTALRNLEFSYSNFAQDQLQVLVDCIPEESNCPILLDIKLWYTGITESSQTRRMINALKEKAPHVSVYY